jgi:LysR family hydrogen peroxide-inducible transcriptional activator
VRLGVIPTVAPYLLPRALPRVRRRHPELRLRLREQDLADRDAGAEEQSDVRATSLGTLLEMACAGAGVTLLPELALESETRGSALAVVPFAKPAPHRTIGIAWRPSSGRAAEFAPLADSLAPPRVD